MFTPGFYWGSCYSIFGFMCIVCRLLFVPLVLFHLATVDCPSVFCVLYVNLPGMSEVLCLRSSLDIHVDLIHHYQPGHLPEQAPIKLKKNQHCSSTRFRVGCIKRHFQQLFSYIVAVNFIGRGNHLYQPVHLPEKAPIKFRNPRYNSLIHCLNKST